MHLVGAKAYSFYSGLHFRESPPYVFRENFRRGFFSSWRPKMLLVTESAVEFDKLRDELLQDIQPQGAIERQYAEDIAYLTWEVRRYRETKAGIINAALLSALKGILDQVLPTIRPLAKADDLARGWFDDKKAKAEVMKLLQTHGLDESAIAAEAFRLRAEDIERCNRMEAVAEARREKGLRVIGKVRKKLAARLRQGSDRLLEKPEAAPLVPEAGGSD